MIRPTKNSAHNRFVGFGLLLIFIAGAAGARSAETSRTDAATRRSTTRGESHTAISTAILPPEWFEDHLADPSLRELVSARFADHHRLTRSDMIATFGQAAESETIDPDQFQTLRFVVENAKLLGMPSYVSDLARKVAFGDPANSHFQRKPMGDLKPGASGTHLKALVRKWFLGEDPPAIDSKLHYQRVAGVLFDGAPKLPDLHQGDLGDCYFIAALGELALRNPEQIARMFIDNHDGTVTVRFFRDGRPAYVTVDRYLPVDANGRFVYENRGDAANNPKNILWVALAEKALAQLNESGWLKTAGTAGDNSFAAIGTGGKSKVTLPLITGLASSRDGLDTLGAFAKGELELANSKTEVPDSLVPHHSYVVVGYDPTSEQVTLFNPWGLHGNKKNIKYGRFSVSWQDFVADFSSIDHVAVNGRANPVQTAKDASHTAGTARKNVPNRATAEQTAR